MATELLIGTFLALSLWPKIGQSQVQGVQARARKGQSSRESVMQRDWPKSRARVSWPQTRRVLQSGGQLLITAFQPGFYPRR